MPLQGYQASLSSGINVNLDFHLLNSVDNNWGDGKSVLYSSTTPSIEEKEYVAAKDGIRPRSLILVQ